MYLSMKKTQISRSCLLCGSNQEVCVEKGTDGCLVLPCGHHFCWNCILFAPTIGCTFCFATENHTTTSHKHTKLVGYRHRLAQMLAVVDNECTRLASVEASAEKSLQKASVDSSHKTSPPSCQEQKLILLTAIANQPLKRAGDIWFIIDGQWALLFDLWINELIGECGPITNHNVRIDLVTRKILPAELPYSLVDRKTWSMLIAWYGGGPEVPIVI
jgi:hypothetical protein